MITEQSRQIVLATAPLVAANAVAITRRFYEILFREVPQVQAFFNQAHQDSGAQQSALAGAICAYVANLDQLEKMGPAVELIAQKHCSLGIQPQHYPIVGKYLLIAVKEVLGDPVTQEVLDAWGEAYQQLADIFINREQQIYQDQQQQPGGWTGTRAFEVTHKHPESAVVTSFHLKPKDGQPVPQYLPGQYITVHIDLPEGQASPRNYSISDTHNPTHFRISVKREVALKEGARHGVVSNFLHDNVHVGDVIKLGPPCGSFVVPEQRDANRPIVFLAGGIGMTPLLSMLKSVVRKSPQTPVIFIQAALNSQVCALNRELKELSDRHPQLTIHTRFNNPLDQDLASGLCDSVGLVDEEFLSEALTTFNADFFICGPAPFMRSQLQTLKARNVSDDSIHYEFFGPLQELATASR